MVYEVRRASRVIEELDRVYDYISIKFSPEGAKRKIRRIREKMNQLRDMPGGFDFDDRLGKKLNPDFKTQALVCDDYLILFVVDEENQIVIVTHLIPSKSDYMRLLKKEN
jgi:plasmid stabilization system protein ParE